jgi:hypothetical protein
MLYTEIKSALGHFCHAPAGIERVNQLLSWFWTTEIIALDFGTPSCADLEKLILRFHTFGDSRHS